MSADTNGCDIATVTIDVDAVVSSVYSIVTIFV